MDVIKSSSLLVTRLLPLLFLYSFSLWRLPSVRLILDTIRDLLSWSLATNQWQVTAMTIICQLLWAFSFSCLPFWMLKKKKPKLCSSHHPKAQSQLIFLKKWCHDHWYRSTWAFLKCSYSLEELEGCYFTILDLSNLTIITDWSRYWTGWDWHEA